MLECAEQDGAHAGENIVYMGGSARTGAAFATDPEAKFRGHGAGEKNLKGMIRHVNFFPPQKDKQAKVTATRYYPKLPSDR